MDFIELNIFPLSLIGEAIIWLLELPYRSNKHGKKMQKAFLERYLPTSKKLKLKGLINNFQQTYAESISAT